MSDRESRANDTISVLAIAETVCAVAIYWWLANTIGSYAFLVISPVLALFVLFRSQDSVDLGLKLYESFWEEVPVNLFHTGAIAVLSFLLAGAMNMVVSSTYLPMESRWATYGVLALLVAATFNIALLVTAAVAGVQSLVSERTNAILAARVGVVVALSSNLTAAYAALDGNEMQTMSLLVIVGTAIVFAAMTKFTAVEAMAALLFGPGIVAGVLVRVYAIRFYAVFRNFSAGLRQFSLNWRSLVLCHDFAAAPELLPGIPKDDGLAFETIIKSDRDTVGLLAKYTFLFVLYPPNIVYRITLKSTAWLYLPLIWLTYVPKPLRDPERIGRWIKNNGRSWIDVFSLFSALLVFLFASWQAFDPDLYQDMREASDGLMPSPMHLLLVFDVEKLQFWHWITLPSAGLTIALWLWFDWMRRYESLNQILPKISWMIRLAQFQKLLVYAWITLAFLSFTESTWNRGLLPQWMEPLLKYGVVPINDLFASNDQSPRQMDVICGEGSLVLQSPISRFEPISHSRRTSAVRAATAV